MLNIALPKGRLGDQVYELLASVGYDCKSIYDENRKLVFENPQTGVRYLLVKPSDVAIYVEHHAADVGIVGKDILMESNPDVYELLDLDLEMPDVRGWKRGLRRGQRPTGARGNEIYEYCERALREAGTRY